MAMDPGQIEKLIKEGIPDAQVTIEDLRGDGDHARRQIHADRPAECRREREQMHPRSATQVQQGAGAACPDQPADEREAPLEQPLPVAMRFTIAAGDGIEEGADIVRLPHAPGGQPGGHCARTPARRYSRQVLSANEAQSSSVIVAASALVYASCAG